MQKFSFLDIDNTAAKCEFPADIYCVALHTKDYKNGTFKIRVFQLLEADTDASDALSEDKFLAFCKNQAFVTLFDGRNVHFIETFAQSKFFKIALSHQKLEGYKHLMQLPSTDIWNEISNILVPNTDQIDKGWPIDGFELFDQMRQFSLITISTKQFSDLRPKDVYLEYDKTLGRNPRPTLLGIVYRNSDDIPLDYYEEFDAINDEITFGSKYDETYLVWSYAYNSEVAGHEYQFIEAY